MTARSALAPSILLFCAVTVQAQQPPPFFGRNAPAVPTQAAHAGVKPHAIVKPRAASSGQTCKTVTYEGLADRANIPTISGISANGWIAGISVAAYGLQLGDHTGLHAQYINEPSPVTTAVFYNTNSDDITFSPPVSSVS